MPSEIKSNHCPQISISASVTYPRLRAAGRVRECVSGEGGGHGSTAPSIVQPGNSVSELAKEGDMGCVEEANTCSSLPPSLVVMGLGCSSAITAPSSEDSLRQWFSVPSTYCQHRGAVRKYQHSDSRSNTAASPGVGTGFWYFKNM